MKIVDNRPEKSTIIKKREIISMPEGYYSGDHPNPNLRKFVEDHLKEHPYDPEKDDYNVPAFNTPIETTKATAIYNMHTYWSKKPHDAIRQYIRHYTKPGDLVLDPFCGSGGTALAALIEGRAAIAIDRSPAATFITKNYCTPVNVLELRAAFNSLKEKVKPEIDWLYETKCDRCGGKATIVYTVYSQVFQCPKCLEKVPLFDCVEIDGKTASGKPKKISVCPYCFKDGHFEEISTRSKRFGAIPVLINYNCQGKCKPKRDQRKYNDNNAKKREFFKKYDLAKLEEIEAKSIPYWYPPHKMMNVEDDSIPWGDNWRPGRNFRTVSELFTKQNLWGLAAILNAIKSSDFLRELLLFGFSSCLLNGSKLYRYRESGKGGISMGTYYLGATFQNMNTWNIFEDKINSIIKGFSEITLNSNQIMISCESVKKMTSIPSQSIDYIFTDPPYSWKIQYGELNFIWEAWLGFDTKWHEDEIIISETRGKTEKDWASMMFEGMKECFRVLKPGRTISLCYHDTSEGTWALIQDLMTQSNFIPERVDTSLYIDTGQKSQNQLMSDIVTKRDLIINFRRPQLGEVTSTISLNGEEDTTTFNQKVTLIIRDYLNAHPGATKDRIYDEVVSRMVRKGQMEAHNFVTLLEMVADPILSGTNGNGQQWYLKETELSVLDAAETKKEDASAEKVEKYIAEHLTKNPEQEGVHYSDIFEYYLYAIKDKPRRPLGEWLLDYFYKAENGTYRLPITEEEKQIKKEGRSKGVSRRIKHYIAQIEQGVAIQEKNRPNDATLAEWLRHCRRAGMYEQGKLLFEKGGIRLDTLSEEQQVAIEEDYGVCVRMLSRKGITISETKRGKRKKDVIQL